MEITADMIELQAKKFKEVLEFIANYDVEEQQNEPVNEWSEATAFSRCQSAATEILRKYDV